MCKEEKNKSTKYRIKQYGYYYQAERKWWIFWLPVWKLTLNYGAALRAINMHEYHTTHQNVVHEVDLVKYKAMTDRFNKIRRGRK